MKPRSPPIVRPPRRPRGQSSSWLARLYNTVGPFQALLWLNFTTLQAIFRPYSEKMVHCHQYRHQDRDQRGRNEGTTRCSSFHLYLLIRGRRRFSCRLHKAVLIYGRADADGKPGRILANTPIALTRETRHRLISSLPFCIRRALPGNWACSI